MPWPLRPSKGRLPISTSPKESDPESRYAINVIENDAGELLFLKRHPAKALGSGKWGFCAGHIEADETPAQCAARELSEELGTDVGVALLQSFGPVRDTLYGGRFEIWLFHQRYVTGDIVLNEEHTEYRWVGQADYPALDSMAGIDDDLEYLNIWQDLSMS